VVSSPGFFFRPEASAPWMAKGGSPLQQSHGGRAPGRKEKAQERGKNRKKWIIQGRGKSPGRKAVKKEFFKDEYLLS